MRKIFSGEIILLYSLIIVAIGCNSVKRNAVHDTVKRDSISITTQVQQKATQIESHETKQATKNNTSIEVQTSDNTDFPQNADTTIEVVKILRSLPKGSKVRITHGIETKAAEKKEDRRDTSSQQQQKATEVHTDSQHKEVQKQSKRFPTIAAIGIVAVIGIMIILFIKLPSFKHEKRIPGKTDSTI